MKVTVDFVGGKALDQALSQFDERKRRTIMRKALDAGGQIMAKSMREKAPVDTGGLRESIDVSGKLSRTVAAVHPKKAEIERYVGPDNRPSAIMQEFGTESQHAQPFVRPAFDETGESVLKRIGDTAWIEIEKAAKAAARKAARG